MNYPFKKYSHFRSRLDKPLPSFAPWELYELSHPHLNKSATTILFRHGFYSPISDPLYKNAQKKKNKMYSDLMDQVIETFNEN